MTIDDPQILIVLPGFKHREESSFIQLMIVDVATATANEYDSLADMAHLVLTVFGAIHLAIWVTPPHTNQTAQI